MKQLTIWGRTSAFNVQKVLWLADELSLDYQLIEAGGRHGGLDDPTFRAMNPHGRVPVIMDGELAVWESHAILRYLAAGYGTPDLWPADPGARSHIDRWMDWGQTTFQPDFMRLFWGFYRCPPSERDSTAITAARTACEQRVAVLEGELYERDWLAGPDFSLADVAVGTALYRYIEMGADTSLPPTVARWYDRLAERPAYRDRVMIAFDELAGQPTFEPTSA